MSTQPTDAIARSLLFFELNVVALGATILMVLGAATSCQESSDETVDGLTPHSEPFVDASADSTSISADLNFATVAPDDETCRHGTLVLRAEEFIRVDPARYDAGSSFLYEQVYSRLFSIDADTLELAPDLVASFTVSDDGRTYLFKIRDDITFSDGSDLHASDVLFSLTRVLRPSLQSTSSVALLGDIAGAEQVMRGDATDLAGVTVIDPFTIQVHLDAPDWDFTAKLAHPVTSILNESNVAQWDPRWLNPDTASLSLQTTETSLPIGTGPLAVSQLQIHRNGAVYVPNEHHWGSSASVSVIQRDPYVAGPHIAESEFNDFDIIEVGHEVALSFEDGQPTTFDGDPIEGYRIVASSRVSDVSFLVFNTAVAPYEDVNFRRALSSAANISGLGLLASSPALRNSASGLIPPGIRGYVERPVHTPDRAAAERAANLSQYFQTQEEPRLSIHIVDRLSPFDVDMLTGNWSGWLGINVGMVGMTETSVGYSINSDQIEDYQRKLADGTLQLRFVEVQPTRNSPEEILGLFRNLFGPNADSPEVRELNALLDTAAAEADAMKRTQLYADIEAYILDRALAIPIAWGSSTKYELVREWISGYEPSRYPSSAFKNVTVDTSHPNYPSDRPCR